MLKKIRILSNVIALAVSGWFLGYMISLNILPDKFMILAGACIGGLPAIFLIIGFLGKGKVNHITGIVFSIIWLIFILFVGHQLTNTMKTVKKISGKTMETHSVAVCVRKNDGVSKVKDLKDYKFGAIELLDQKNTGLTVDELKNEMGTDVKPSSYSDATTLVLALLAKKVDAIILNEAYFSLVEEEEKYESLLEHIKVVKKYEFKEEIAIKPVQTENKEEMKNENNIADSFVMYISGIDTAGAISKTSRSDVNILAVVNTKTKKILLVNTPRDYFVPLSISHGVKDKLTHAGIYGVDVSKDTLGMLYGVKADYYFRVNFSGFKKIVDALGGVTVYSEYEFSNSYHGDKSYFKKGYNTLNGTQALGFARERYSFSGGDRQRGKNQMAIITAIVEKAQTSAMLKNYSGFLNGISDSFETNLSANEIAKLVQMQLSDQAKWSVENISVDGSGSSQKTYSMSRPCYVMVPNMSTVNTAREKIKQILEGN